MTDKLDALDKLIAAVEAGHVDANWYDYLELPKGHGNATIRAYHGSLDAALALHNALLPGWVATVWAGGEAAGVKYWWATVEDWNSGEEVSAENLPSPARAWLLAIIKAYRAQVAG